MAKRFFVGLLKGVLLGVVMSLLWAKALDGVAFDGLFAYLLAMVTGALAGIVAGKPFWAKGALIEASLKGFVGALFATAALYGMRKWLHLELPLGSLGGALGFAAIPTLTTLATLLGALFELDNTGAELATDKTARVIPGKVRAAEDTAELEDGSDLGASIEPRLHRKG